MDSSFKTFQKFNDLNLAETVADSLKKNGIECFIENTQKFFDPSFANNTFDADISIKIRSDDFAKANTILSELYSKSLNDVDKNYYLFDFSDEELRDIIAKPDEWGRFDFMLAEKILKDRGMEVSPNVVEELKEKRITELSQPETFPRFWIIIGYTISLLGGLFGIMIGSFIAFSKKTLPNGRSAFFYNEKARMHGKIIFYLGIAGLIFWTFKWFKPL